MGRDARFLSLAQDPRQAVQVAVRASGDAGPVARQFQSRIADFGPFIPVSDVETLASRLARTLAYPRFRALALGFFALAALMLAAVGLYGVLSQIVAQRVAELGLRRALGAQTHDLLLLIARQGGLPVLVGLGTGLCLTLLFSRVLSSLLYGTPAVNARMLPPCST